MYWLPALCPRLKFFSFFFFFLFTKSLKSLRSLVLVLILQKQEVGQQAEKVMLLSATNCSDDLVPGPLLLCPLAASSSD